jgi:hypothetical protein
MLMSIAKGYRVSEVTFEWHHFLGPIIINRHTEEERPCNNISLRNWSAINKFSRLAGEKRKLYRIY